MSKAIVTRESLQEMLDNAEGEKLARIVGRALLVLFNNQTKDEQSFNTTNKDVSVYFTSE